MIWVTEQNNQPTFFENLFTPFDGTNLVREAWSEYIHW
ncbi:Uncharacterised protein [Vibrio alginolyticus]|jgi:hypothetical protein|nr:Uncharacterised protein [Vibrio alginolyticus]